MNHPHNPQYIIELAVTSAGKKVVNYTFMLIFAGYLFVAFIGWLGTGGNQKDDTDGYKRSNMALRTDYGTGCQYLESHTGVLTPRMSADGKHVGCKAVVK